MTVTEHARTVWRGVRGRGWRAVLTIALLAIALAANAIVFSAADSLVFDRVPYPHADRLVQIVSRNSRTGAIGSPFISAAMLDAWQRQTDVFASVQGYLTKTLFLTGGATVRAPIADVTPGLFELLGTLPRWGRTLMPSDAAQVDPQVVLVSEGLARERFGDPARAVGQTLSTASRPLVIAGVMPEAFAFPDSAIRIWRALDPAGPLAKGFAGVQSIARLAADVPPDTARALVHQRAPSVGIAAASRRPYDATLAALPMVSAPETERRLFLLILGTAICLLLTAAANVAGLEVAGALARAKTHAMQLALGAGRRRLVAASLAEGLFLVAAATAVALVAARAGATALAAYLPERLVSGSVKPIALDVRALAYMSAVALITWVLASLPLLLFVTRAQVGELLKHGGSSTPPPRGSRARRVLTIAEIAIAIVLLLGTALYARTYLALVALDRGFDTSNVAAVSVSLPAQVYPTLPEKRDFATSAIVRLKAAHLIVDGMWGSPPSANSARYNGHLEIDGGPPREEDTSVGAQPVTSAYFSTIGIPLRGRTFADGEEFSSAIVNQSMATKMWPGRDPIGHRFRWDPHMPWLRVVGVAGDVRTDLDPPDRPRGGTLQVYQPLPSPSAANAPRVVAPAEDNGGSYGFVDMVVRVDRSSRIPDVLRLVRELEPRAHVAADMLDDEYAARYADRLLAARVVGGFGCVALLLAGAGLYGMMTFLVASRAKEIGIRMALGADRAAIRRLVVRSSAALFATGIALGALISVAASRTIASQLFGVTPADPASWLVVTAAVLALAALATWRPAHAATRLDPSTLLRS